MVWTIDKQKEYNKEYYKNHKEEIKDAARRYYHANKKAAAIKAREYHVKNKEADSNRKKKWYRANKDAVRNRAAEWYSKNKESEKRKRRERYEMNVDNFNERRRKQLSDPVNRMNKLTANARYRAKKLGLPIDESLIAELRSNPPMSCSCCNDNLNYETGSGIHKRSPSLDRIESDKGYVSGNVKVICFRCNILKRDATLDEIENIRMYMRRHLLRNAPFKPYVIQPQSCN